jgi:hypothetical protein
MPPWKAGMGLVKHVGVAISGERKGNLIECVGAIVCRVRCAFAHHTTALFVGYGFLVRCTTTWGRQPAQPHPARVQLPRERDMHWATADGHLRLPLGGDQRSATQMHAQWTPEKGGRPAHTLTCLACLGRGAGRPPRLEVLAPKNLDTCIEERGGDR